MQQAALTSEWTKLPAHAQRSNLRSVRQGALQLAALGLQWRGMAHGNLPRIAPDMAQEISQAIDGFGKVVTTESPHQQKVQSLARSEHARWMIDKAIEGVRQGPLADDGSRTAIRDNQRGWHTQMRPFDDLKPDMQKLDLVLLSTLVKECRNAGDMRGLAYWRKIEALDVEHGPVTCADASSATELELTIPPSRQLLSEANWITLNETVRSWAGHPQACRLLLRITSEDRFVDDPKGDDPKPLRGRMSALLRWIEGVGIAVDVTWIHVPTAIQSKSESSE